MTGRSGRCGERSQGVRLTVHPAKSTKGRGHASRTLFASLLAAPGPDKSFRFTRPRITLRTRPPRTKCGGSTHRECRTPALASLFLGTSGEPGIHETSGAVERCNSCTPILQSGQILHRRRAGVTPHPRKLPRKSAEGCSTVNICGLFVWVSAAIVFALVRFAHDQATRQHLDLRSGNADSDGMGKGTRVWCFGAMVFWRRSSPRS